ncbi:TasA family protein [Geodermatophilus ruber]|uniref:Camelysin metallo-endopeptidase n=1 Tax=Geodermatophilus ruber TaxID=504800 RepID=A0A1I4LZJ2_9ACTN|nr:TasA family protein [Geodermatophilus ruber]SFL96186.1 Camelysin metallo-endopeptidase [Geodermatophilus ruber]
MSKKTRTSTARKVVGSLGVIGTAAAVAGLGTFGTFTDSTAPVSTQVQSGTVSIDLAQGPIAIPASTTGFVPGDTMSRLVTLRNDGGSALSSVTLSVTPSKSNVLTTDKTNGLQLSLQACSGTWTQGGAPNAPTYTCTNGTTRNLVAPGGVARTNEALVTPASLNPGGADQLVFTISLPTSANNNFQGLDTQLSLVFEGTQRNGTAR